MRAALRRLTLERAIQLAVTATVLTTVLAAGAILEWVGIARKLRWGALLVFVALAVSYAWTRRASLPRGPIAFAAAFCTLALVSVGWSAFPWLTLARGIAFSLVVLAAVCLAAGAAARNDSVERLLGSVLAAATLVALGGLAVLLLRYDRAVQPATTVSPARYQGLGGGPNMAAMTLAVATPIAAHYLLRAYRAGKYLAGAVLVLLLASIAFSGSRGAIAAVAAGLLLFALLAPRAARVRAFAVGAAVAAVALTVAVAQIPSTADTNPPQPTGIDPEPADVTPGPGFFDAQVSGPRLQDEIGHPGVGVADTRRRVRTLLGSSGRAEAWDGALSQSLERPLVGHGFGTEDRVFVDRYVFFNSGVPENSFLGLTLQLGAAGLAVFVLFAGSVLTRTIGAFSRLDERRRSLAAAGASVFIAGLVLALFQSYVYAAGNNATAVIWVAAFLGLAATVPAR